MTFWKFLDENGGGIGLVVIVLALLGVVGGLAYTKRIWADPEMCRIPCSEVRAK